MIDDDHEVHPPKRDVKPLPNQTSGITKTETEQALTSSIHGKITANTEEIVAKPQSFKVTVPYEGPIFPGEARVPIGEEIEKCKKLMHRRSMCVQLINYLLFLVVYVSIEVCYPIKQIGEMGTEVKEWMENRNWGDQNDIEDVTDQTDFYQWLEEVVIESIWEDENSYRGVVMGYNSIVGGIVLWQRKRDFSTQCSPIERHLVVDCVTVAEGNHWNTSQVDPNVAKLRPKFTPFVGNDRDAFTYEYIPVASPNNAETRYETLEATLSRLSEIKSSKFLDAGTEELIVQMVMYNANTKLVLSMEIRFTVEVTGGLDNEIIVWAGLLNTLSDQFMQAGGANWKFRIALEIIFVLRIIQATLTELAEIYISVRDHGIKKGKYLNFWNVFDWFLIILASLLIWIQVEKYTAEQEISQYFTEQEGENIVEKLTLIGTLANLDFLFSVVNSLTLLTAFFRLFKYFQFHPRLGVVSRTISVAWTNLVHFMVVVALLLVGFSLCGWILFSKSSARFKTLLSSVGAVGQMLTLGIGYEELVIGSVSMDYKWWAWLPSTLFYYGFMFIMVVLLLNILLAIVIGAYDSVKDEVDIKPLEETTMYADINDILRPVYDCFRKRETTNRVSAENAAIVTHNLRPPEYILLGELQEVKAMIHHGIDEPTDPDRITTPFRSVSGDIEECSFTVVFNYADLAQTFSSDVARYLWALYGPNSQETNIIEKETQSSLPEETFSRILCLESSVDEMHKKLDKLCTMMKAQEEANPLVDSPTKADIASELTNALSSLNIAISSEKKRKKRAMSPSVDTPSSSSSSSSSSDEGYLTRKQKSKDKKSLMPNRADAFEEPDRLQGDSVAEDGRLRLVTNLLQEDIIKTFADPQDEEIKNFLLPLFDENGRCLYSKIKEACSQHDWSRVKRVRKELGIIQFSKRERGEGKPTLVKYWRLKSAIVPRKSTSYE